jgi:hypothetical protein
MEVTAIPDTLSKIPISSLGKKKKHTKKLLPHNIKKTEGSKTSFEVEYTNSFKQLCICHEKNSCPSYDYSVLTFVIYNII